MDEEERRQALVEGAKQVIAEYDTWCRRAREVGIGDEELKQLEAAHAHLREFKKKFGRP